MRSTWRRNHRAAGFLATVGCGALVAVAITAATSRAADPPAAIRDRAIERVSLPNGEDLQGLIAQTDNDGNLRMVVRREWLSKRAPKSFKRVTEKESESARELLEGLKERLTDWRLARSDDAAIAGYIDRRLEAIEEQLAAGDKAEPTQLVVVDVPAADVKGKLTQKPDRRKLLALAFEHQLSWPEDRGVVALAKELKEKGVEIAASTPDLSDRIPAMEIDDRQWAAKVALVEFSLIGKPTWQGDERMLFQTDDPEKKPDVQELLGGAIGGQLEDLLGGGGAGRKKPTDPVKKATDAAEADGRAGVRVTQVVGMAAGALGALGGGGGNAGGGKVRVRFLAKMPNGEWATIIDISKNADPSKVKKEDLEAIKQDPQVAELLKQLGALGLGGGGEGLLDSALRGGAAAMLAQKDAEKSFSEFILRGTRRLDGPTGWNDPGPSKSSEAASPGDEPSGKKPPSPREKEKPAASDDDADSDSSE